MWIIRGKYPGLPWEDIDEDEEKAEAERLLKEYRLAFSSEWRLTLKKVKVS